MSFDRPTKEIGPKRAGAVDRLAGRRGDAHRNETMASTTISAKRSRKNKVSGASGPGGPWTGHAPRRLRKEYHGEASDEGWTLWRKHLSGH